MVLIDPAVTPIVALASLAVAITSLSVTLYSVRAGGPRVSTQCYFVKEGEQFMLRLVIHNGGRSATDISVRHLKVRMAWDTKPWHDVQETLQPQFEVGFPYRLDGHSTVEWSAPATELVNQAMLHYLDSPWFLHLTIGRKQRRIRVPRHAIVSDNDGPKPLH
ncbi:hypothetical protein ACWGA9_05705 [Streptomyces sp. NPDC054950]